MAIPSGEIYLLRDVPLSETYEHSIDFSDSDEQFRYFRTFIKKTISKFTYVRREREFISVELPLNELDDVNYMLFRSAGGERLYYAFVTDKTYNGPNTSYIYFSVDVIQTFQFNIEWKASYIKRAHVDRWSAEHKPIYSKTDEGLDYGSEYSIESAFKIEQSNAIRWLLVTMKDYDAILSEGYSTDYSNTQPAPSTFVSFLVPFSISKSGGAGVQQFHIANSEAVQIVGGGANVNIGSYEVLLKGMLKQAIGDYIISISLLTYNPFVTNVVKNGDNYDIFLNPGASYGIAKFKISESEADSAAPFLIIRSAAKEVFNNILARADWNVGLADSLPTAKQWEEIKQKPYTTERDKRFESKLLAAPYRYNLLSDWRNTPVIFKNEYLTGDKIEINYALAISHNAPSRYWIKDYKKDPEGRNTCLMQAMAPEFPIINDAYSSYILQNKNTIQTNVMNGIINAGAGVVSGAIAGGGVGGIAGAAYGAISGAASGALNVAAQIRSENAKQADLRAVTDGIINSTDSAFNVVDGTDVITFYRMRICCENEAILANIFNMYGYTVNRLEIPNTKSRTRFNYIQTLGANITGSISHTFLNQIKAIFDNGITLWHYNNEHFNMLDYTYENVEVNLI